MAEHVSLKERLAGLLYLFTLCLALTVLWAMAETQSAESRTRYYPPISDDMQKLVAAAGAE